MLRIQTWTRAHVLLLLSVTVLLGAGCQRVSPPRLVILYATCSLNRTFLQPYDPAVGYTPALARLAREGTVFERHQTESGQSGPAFASIFSGLQAPGHGIYRHPNVLRDEKLLIGEIFAADGWDTHAFLHHVMASAGLNYDQGVPADHSHRRPLEGDLELFSSILRSLQSDPERKTFVVTNFTDTHAPYSSKAVEAFCALYPGECGTLRDPEEARQLEGLMWTRMHDFIWNFERLTEELGYDETRKRKLLDLVEILYKSNVWRLDRRVGELVDAIEAAGLLDETLIVFTADHGEILYREGAHFFFTHGYQLAPEVLNVPMIVYGPGAGVPAGRYERVTRSIDVAWTTAGLAGVPVPLHEGDGRDLSRTIRGQEPPPELIAYSHTALMMDAVWNHVQRSDVLTRLHPTQGPESMWVGARREDLLFQRRRDLDGSWRTLAVDLSAGPNGPDRFDPADPAHREMAAELAAYKATLVEDAARALDAELPILEEENRALLRMMGYIE